MTSQSLTLSSMIWTDKFPDTPRSFMRIISCQISRTSSSRKFNYEQVKTRMYSKCWFTNSINRATPWSWKNISSWSCAKRLRSRTRRRATMPVRCHRLEPVSIKIFRASCLSTWWVIKTVKNVSRHNTEINCWFLIRCLSLVTFSRLREMLSIKTHTIYSCKSTRIQEATNNGFTSVPKEASRTRHTHFRLWISRSQVSPEAEAIKTESMTWEYSWGRSVIQCN